MCHCLPEAASAPSARASIWNCARCRSNVPLLNKLYCPREVFPIAAIADAAVDALIATLVLAVLFPITGFAPKAQVFYLPLLLIVLLMFTLGVTIAVSSIVVYMRDL